MLHKNKNNRCFCIQMLTKFQIITKLIEVLHNNKVTKVNKSFHIITMLLEACTIVIITFHVTTNSPQGGFMLHLLHKHLVKLKKVMVILLMEIFVKIIIEVMPCNISLMCFLIIISSYDLFQKIVTIIVMIVFLSFTTSHHV